MRILITNDDGIEAEGIIRLAAAAAAFGEVWVVAPDRGRSAASHCITLHSPIDIFPHEFPVPGVHAFSCTGMPADCVRVGSLSVMPEKPDVVLSGINYGHNVASDIQYSATIGAALEASFQGIRGIALSEGADPDHSVTDAYLLPVLEKWIGSGIPEGQILNINFPKCPLAECRGILEDRTVSKSVPFTDRYREIEKLPGSGARFMVEGLYREEAEEGSDFRALIDRYISAGFVRNLC